MNTAATDGVLELHQYPAAWDRIPSLGQLCVKVATYLRMTGVPYQEVAAEASQGPHHKLPFVLIGDQVLTDSELIVQHLEANRVVPLDAGLSAQQRALSHALRRMLEEHTYFTSVWFRWGEDRAWPHMQRFFEGTMGARAEQWLPVARKYMNKQLYHQGIARHDSATILARVDADLEVVEAHVAAQPYLLGEQPSCVDASAFAMLEALLDSPWDPPEAELIRGRPAVAAYVERIRERYWGDWYAERPSARAPAA